MPLKRCRKLAAATRGPFANQQWLAGLITYRAWRLAGYDGVVGLFVVAYVAAFVMLFALLRRRGASVPLRISSVVLALFGTLTQSFVRAQIFALGSPGDPGCCFLRRRAPMRPAAWRRSRGVGAAVAAPWRDRPGRV